MSHHGNREGHQQPHCRDLCDPKDKKGGDLPKVQPGESRERSPQDALRSTNPVIPSLPPVNKRNSSIEAADWLAEVRPLIGDISNKASRWWEMTMDRTVEVYQTWLHSNPLQRLRIQPPDPVPYHGLGSEQVIQRLEQRVTTILLPSLPLELRNDLITSRQLWPCAILYKILRSYQPGGWAERSSLLMDLTTTKAAKDPASAATALRLWHRQKQRALELGAAIPDALLQVRALETIVSQAVAKHPQSLFRISTFRMETGLDEQPNDTSIAQFLELLTAEMDAAALGTSMPEAQQQSSAKMMLAENDGNGSQVPLPSTKAIKLANGKSQEKGGGKCHNWGTEQGCRFTRNCRFEHVQLPDAASRCWLCSSTLHQKHECPYRPSWQSGEATTGGSEKGAEKGKGKENKGKGKSKSWKGGQGGESGKGAGNLSSSSSTNGTTAPTSTTTSPTKENGEGGNPVVKAAVAEDPGKNGEAADGLLSEVTSLLKSLRIQQPQMKACNLRRIGDGSIESMLLDGGATHCLRKARSRREWEGGVPIDVQLATGSMKLRINPITKTLMVEKENVQPIIPVNKLTELGYEVSWTKSGCSVRHVTNGNLDVDLEQGCPIVRWQVGEKLMEEIEEMERNRAALRAVFFEEKDAASEEEKALIKLKKLFPEVPLEILEKIPGKRRWSGHELPFNRRRRRQIEQAHTVVVHLFAGKADPRWQQQEGNGVVVICLDVLGGCDLLHNHSLAGWLEELAESGRVQLWMSGPPCRTVSALRNKQDGGPPVLRGRVEGRFGLSSLTPKQQDYVDGDTILWLRSLWWMTLANESGKKAEYLVEQPLDPEEWMAKNSQPELGFPSFMCWKESRDVFNKLGLEVIRMEQGALGHLTPKPTMLATNVPEVVVLDQLKSDSYDPMMWVIPLEERIQKSKELASWAPGLKEILCRVIRRIHSQEPRVRALTAKERQEVQAWQDHHRAGHLPHRKDCPTCLLAAGRDRQHRRLACPVSYALSLDIVGPFYDGTDQGGGKFKYGLVGVYTIPIDGSGSPLPEGLRQLQVGSKLDGDSEDEGEEQPRHQPGGQEPGELPGLEEEEEGEAEEVDEAVVQQQEILGNGRSSSRIEEQCESRISPLESLLGAGKRGRYCQELQRSTQRHGHFNSQSRESTRTEPESSLEVDFRNGSRTEIFYTLCVPEILHRKIPEQKRRWG